MRPGHEGGRLGLVRRQFDDDRAGTRQPGPRLREHRLDIGAVRACRRCRHAATSAATGSRRTSAGEIGPLRGRRRRADWRRPGRPRPAIGTGSGSSQFPCTKVTGRTAPACCRRTRSRFARATAKRGGAGVGGPNATVGMAVGQFGGQGEGDGARTGPGVDHGGRRGARVVRSRPGRPRRPVRSRAAGSARARSTSRSRERKAQCPRTYCSGSPARRRAARVRAVSTSAGSGHAVVAGRGRAEHLFDDEARFVSGAQRGGELRDQLAPGHGAPSSSPASWRARLSAIRASVSSVRSPARTWSSL